MLTESFMFCRKIVYNDVSKFSTAFLQGDEAIRSIVINLSRIKQLQLNPQVFARMSKLHFLDFYSKGSCSCLRDQGGLYLPQGLESLSNELRYLRWTHYPLESLPSKFSAENLVELNLPNSRLKKLWQEAPVSIMYLYLF